MPNRKVRSHTGPNERRRSNRLPIAQPASYRARGQRKGDESSGSGNTLDMSASGVLFTTESSLSEGERVELAVAWPATLDGVALKLVVSGRVVRAEIARAAMSIERYEFKTARRAPMPDFQELGRANGNRPG